MYSPVESIGFIGLGAMGFPMARRLLQGGKYSVTVLDIDRSRMDSLKSEGASIAETPRAIAEKSDLVITMLPNSPEVETVMFGDDGVVAGLGKDNIVIDMSTIDPSVTRKVADEVHTKGAHMLDAPVGRTSFHAESGELLIMVGGEDALLTHCRAVLEHFGKDIIHCGPVSSGGTMKLVNNILTTTIVAANAEALVLGARAGLDTECMLKVLRSTAASNTHLASTYAVQALAGNIKPGFAVKLAVKRCCEGLL